MVNRVLGWLDVVDAACFSFSPPNTCVLCTLQQVQLDIRTGHAQTVEKVLGWLDEEGGIKGTAVCDCGCGTGSLAVPLALRVCLSKRRFLCAFSREVAGACSTIAEGRGAGTTAGAAAEARFLWCSSTNRNRRYHAKPTAGALFLEAPHATPTWPRTYTMQGKPGSHAVCTAVAWMPMRSMSVRRARR